MPCAPVCYILLTNLLHKPAAVSHTDVVALAGIPLKRPDIASYEL